MSAMSLQALRTELLRNLGSWGVVLEEGDADAPLITSGRLDSVALFSLSLWIEEQTGRPVDPSSVNIISEWDTVTRIVDFVQRAHADTAPPTHPQPRAQERGPEPAQNCAADAEPLVARDKQHVGQHAHGLPNAAREPAVDAAGYRIQRCTPELKESVVRLYERLWSSDAALNRRLYEWRYEHNPFASDPLVYVALKDGVPVATRALCGSLWEAGDERHTWYFADDLVIQPEHENHGLFAAFTEVMRRDLLARGAKFFISLSALRVTRLQSLAGGAGSVGAMHPVAYRTTLTRARQGARDVASRMPIAWRVAGHLDARNGARRAFERLDARSQSGGDITAGPVRPADMARLVARLPYDGRFRMVRDERFFTWRYTCPLHDYRFLYATDPDGLAGFLVLERGVSERANSTRVNIADWEARTPEVLERLLVAALDWLRPEELVCWTGTLAPERITCLNRLGFEPVDQEQTARGLPCVLVWPLTSESESLRIGGRSLLDLANWDLRMAYTSMA